MSGEGLRMVDVHGSELILRSFDDGTGYIAIKDADGKAAFFGLDKGDPETVARWFNPEP